jgi:HemY protein
MPLALRLFFTLLLLIAVSLLALWLRDHPGLMRLDWLGYRIETPLAVAMSLLIIIVITLALLLYGFVRLVHFPLRHRLRKQEQRFRDSLDQMTYAMTSLAVADHAGALRYARQAEKQLGEHPLLELVRAHVARRSDDMTSARLQLQKMMEYPTTRMLAASALSHLAHRDERLDEAVRLAQIAFDMQPKHKPSLHTLFNLYLEKEDWEAALLLLEKGRKQAHLSKAETHHYEALISWQQASALTRDGNAPGSALLIRQAFRCEPGFVPAAYEHAARLIAAGHRRRACAVLKRAWRHHPHPMLAELFLDLYETAPASRMTKAVESLTRSQPDHVESHLLRARTALRLTHWDEARGHVGKALDVVQEARIYRFLAEIERRAGHEEAAMRAMERASTASADPCWVCDACGKKSGRWEFYCTHCHSSDSIHWRAPKNTSQTGNEFAIPFDLGASSALA